MAIRKVNTATLIRGQVYTMRHPDHTPQNPKDALRFERNIPKVIDEAHILAMLEDMTEEIPDGEGEVYEKPVFRIDRNVDAPADARSNVTKLSSTRVVKKRARR